MKTIIIKRSGGDKKFKAIMPDGKEVRFGQKGYSDYTLHKNPMRMRSYVVRHGGRTTSSTDPANVHRIMLTRTSSNKETWGARGVNTPGFWSRWLLWSFPDIKIAKKYIENNILKDYKIKLNI